MRNFLFSVVFVFIAANVFGQSRERDLTTRFEIGPAIGFSTHNPLHMLPENKGWGLGIGGFVQAERFFQENLSGVVQAGVMTFAGRSSSANTKNKSYNTIPIRVGANAYAGDLHLGAQIGLGFNTTKAMAGNETSFAYSPQIGYNFTRDNVPLDLTVSYEGYAGHGGFSALLLKLSWIF